MPKLPTVDTYGNRPSLRSNRLDMPDEGDVQMADAVVRAADNFAKVSVRQKHKEDRLNYALAKNDLIRLDLENRAKLHDDEDYDTHDQRYREGVKAAKEEVYSRYALSPDGRAVLDAESDLITERGAVQVGARSKEIMRDKRMAEINENLQDNVERALLADNETANDIIFTTLDQLHAAKDEGVFDEMELQKASQAFVGSVSEQRLEGMPAEMRIAELKKSLAKRRAEGPISQDDIRAGKGTGSLADFLPKHTASEMLEEAEKENEIENELAMAYSIVDSAREESGSDDVKMMQIIRDKSRGKDPSIRARAEQIGRSRAEENRVAKRQQQDDIIKSSGEAMRDGGLTYNDLPASQLKELTPSQDASLRTYSRMLEEQKEFADSTVWVDDSGGKSYAYWRDLTPAQKLDEDLDGPEWRSVLTQDVWRRLTDEQESERDGSTSTAKLPGGMTNQQMVTAFLVTSGIVPQTDRSDDQSEVYQKVLFDFDTATQIAQEQKGAPLTNLERKKVLADIMLPYGYLDRDLTPHGFVLDEKKATAVMKPEELDKARLPIVKARQEKLTIQGIENTYEDILIKIAKDNDIQSPSKKDLERAYFAIKNNMSEPEIVRRLGGD